MYRCISDRYVERKPCFCLSGMYRRIFASAAEVCDDVEMTGKKHISDSVERLINQAVDIEMSSALDSDSLGFMARAMTLATLPHRKVEGNEFERRNGKFTLSLLAPSKVGLPYGTIPRLLLTWLTTEAVKTQSRELILGDSMSEFMRELGLIPSGGRWGSITRLKEQTKRLFSSTINARWDGDDGTAIMNQTIAEKAMLWWHPQHHEQAGLWQSTVVLGEQFFREVIEHPVPIDLRAIRALKQSPLSLDIYVWLTYRSVYLKRETVVPWDALQAQFGSDYARLRDFKEAFTKSLQRVYVVYKDARFSVEERGLLLKPALTHIGRRLK